MSFNHACEERAEEKGFSLAIEQGFYYFYKPNQIIIENTL